MAGAVSVGVDGTSDVAHMVAQLSDCSAVAALVDGTELLAKLIEARSELPELRLVVCEDGASNGARWWGEWLGDAMASDTPLPDASPDDLALLIYVAAPNGEPRGVRITHRCISASAASVKGTLALTERDSLLSFLPYCDGAERIFGLYTRIICGMTVAHVAEQGKLWAAAHSFEPTLFGGLPRSYDALNDALLLTQRALGSEGRAAWEGAIALGRERLGFQSRGEPVPDLLEARWRITGAPIRAELARLLGGNVRVATSWCSTLPTEVGEALAAAGLTVLGGYGTPEHLCVAMQRPGALDTDSAGPPMPGTELRVADGGELLVKRNALTFAGYHNKPAATRAAFTDDGRWLKTGRTAELLPDGRLRIIGRCSGR